MNEEIYIYSDSDIASHNLSIYVTKTLLESSERTVKFLNLLDLARSDLDRFCGQYIGISAFNKAPEHKAIIDKLLNVYAYDIMEDLDQDWWIDKLIDQAENVKSSIPSLAVFCTGINNKKYLDRLKKVDKTVFAVTLEDSSKMKALGFSDDSIFCMDQTEKITDEEHLNERDLEKTRDFIDLINEKQLSNSG